MFLALGASEAIASANTVFVDNSTNPPSLSIEGNEENVGLGLIVTKWGSWTNITAKSDNKVPDITGLNFYSESQDNTLEVLGNTNVYLTGIAVDDGSAGNVEGISIAQGKNTPKINATFNNVSIYAESKDHERSRGKGIWIGGLHEISHDDEIVHEHPEVKIRGDLDITAKSLGWAFGINVGDELGDNNNHGGGHLTLSGAKNSIKVEQTGSPDGEGYLRASAGILISNKAKVDIVSGNTTISTRTNHSGQNATMQGGVILDNDATFTCSGNLTIDSTVTDSSASHTLHGISTDHYNSIVSPTDRGSVATLTGPTFIALHTNNRTRAYGLGAYGDSTIISKGQITVVLDDSQVTAGGLGSFSAVYVSTTYALGANLAKAGQVELNGLSVRLQDGAKFGKDGYYVLRAIGESGTTRLPTITAKGDASTLYQLQGNIDAQTKGIIDLGMSNDKSYLTGWTNNHSGQNNDGTIHIALANGAVWNVISKVNATDNTVADNESTVTTLDLSSGVLNMAYASRNQLTDWEEASHRQLLTITGTGTDQGLSGTGGTIWMDMNLGDEGTADNLNLDQIVVQGSTSGTHNLAVNFVNGLTGISPDKLHSDNWLIEQASGSMTLTGPNGQDTFTGRGMVSMWQVRFVPTGEEDKLDNDRESLDNTSAGKPNNGEGHWYLVRHDQEIPDPDQPVDPDTPPEIHDNITVANSASMALAYDADLEDLRTRIGEVRYGAQDGLWAKAFAKQNRLGGSSLRGFKQEIYGVNVGLDHLVKADEESAWLLGGAFRYSDADQKGLGVGYTTGTLQEYSGKLYATWMHDKGSYADFVLQAGRYEQELDGFDNTGMDKSKADYGTWGFGASVEVGHMFSFGENVDDRQWFNHWFLEPQLQLSYFRAKGADYTTSTGLKVDQGDADYLTGRAGVVLGKKFNYGSINDLDKRYFQIALIGGVKHDFIGGDQDITYTGVDGDSLKVSARDIDGTRFYYGVNADWQLARDWRLYAKFEREKGNDFSEDYDVSVGFKYAF